MKIKHFKIKRREIVILLVLTTILSFFFVMIAEAPATKSIFEPKKEAPVPVKRAEKPAEVKIPPSFLLTVPYTVQAPFANWKVHEESCEEAAVLMYHYYLEDFKVDVLDQYRVDAELKNMKAWQVKNWGAERDLNLETLGKFAQDYYGYKYEVKKNVTSDDIKREVSAGHPVLVPVLTQSLKNPHYSPGNVYHILLIKGYDATGVITNDAGIKEGKDWHYSWEILWSAIDAQSLKMSQGRDLLILTR